METEEDDDIYASGAADSAADATKIASTSAFPSQRVDGQKPLDLEEGEEEDGDEEEESDSVRVPVNTIFYYPQLTLLQGYRHYY